MKVPRACALLTGFVLSLTILPADAATFDWSATATLASLGGFPFIGSGTLTATTGAGGDLVTNVTGSFTTNGPSPVTDMVTGVGPTGSGFTMTNNLIFPIGRTFMGPPVVASGSYTSVANLDTHGLAFDTTAGVFVIYSTVVPNADPSEATGNFYSQVPAGGGFGVGLFDLTRTPPPVNGGQGDNNQGDNNNQGNNNQGNADPAAVDLAAADLAATDPAAAPLPGALPLFATGIGGLGLLGWRRKRKAQTAAA